MSDRKDENGVRAGFRANVFERDNHTCVVPGCGKPAVDAHHIIERSLWTHPSELGGYFPENGASLCAMHHMDAEMNFLTPHALRTFVRVPVVYLPKGFDPAYNYNKWGDVLPAPSRYSIKYPHTPYLDCSPGVDPEDARDRKFIWGDEFTGMPVVITVKMDGSNLFFDNQIVAARNGHDATHKSFDMAKALHAEIADRIPTGLQVFCEWLYAKHSIYYAGELALDHLCQVICVYNRITHEFLSWDDTEKFAKMLDLPTVPVLARVRIPNRNGFNHEIYRHGNATIMAGHEGIVVRNAHSFHWSTFGKNIGKFVRENHVSTSKHWMNEAIIRNEVKE